jgi:hypothetical protein
MVGWILSIVLAFVLTPTLNAFLTSRGGLYEVMQRALAGRFADAVGIDSISSVLPRILKDTVDSMIRQTTDAAAASVCNLLFTIVSFLMIMLAMKFVFFFIISLLSKKHADGVRGAVDGILGLIFGFVKGIFLVFAALAVMIPFMGLFDTKFIGLISGWLDSSFVAGSLYDNNFLALIVRDFLF